MKNLSRLFLGLGVAFFCTGAPLVAQQYQMQQTPTNNAQGTRFGVVNGKKCLEESKLGKQEQVNFEKMKEQMESILKDKERNLEEIEAKINDDDYMDSISDEAASELRRKRKSIKDEGYRLQNQYLQTLQQANMKIIQKVMEMMSKASEQVAKESGNSNQAVDAIFNDEAFMYYNPNLDMTDKGVIKMNALFDAEQRDQKTK